MSDKYIVKNCPARMVFEDINYCQDFKYIGVNKPCAHCTDCLIKQVIERCKESYLRLEEFDEIKGEQEYLCKCSHHNMAASILQLFEIEEVEFIKRMNNAK